MTILRDLLDVGKEKRKKERVKATQKFVVGMGAVAAAGVATGILFAQKPGKEAREDLKKKAVNAAETIKDTVQKKTDAVKDSVAHATQEVSNIIKDVHGKTENVKMDIKNDYYETAQDNNKTADEIGT